MKYYLSLDVGSVRIGVAKANDVALIPNALETLANEDGVFDKISELATLHEVDTIVVGFPRNMDGSVSKQTRYIEKFADHLKHHTDIPIVFQDESVTSLVAEEMLVQSGKQYTKGDVDAQAAKVILNDFLERL